MAGIVTFVIHITGTQVCQALRALSTRQGKSKKAAQRLPPATEIDSPTRAGARPNPPRRARSAIKRL
jgi:hypothetical protein